MKLQNNRQENHFSRTRAFEWLLQRITGVGLVLFLVLHFWVQHMPSGFLATAGEYNEMIGTYGLHDEAFQSAVAAGKIKEALPDEHVITHSKVIERLNSPVWKAITIMLLLFTLLHGMLGLGKVLGDFIQRAPLKKALVACGWAAALLLAGQGIATVMAVAVN